MTITSRISRPDACERRCKLAGELPSQTAATIGARPSRRPGSTISSIQATTSFGRLISASRLPASDSSERRLVLEAIILDVAVARIDGRLQAASPEDLWRDMAYRLATPESGCSIIVEAESLRTDHGRCHAVPSPACGGGTGRGHEHDSAFRPPPPDASPAGGGGSRRSLPLSCFYFQREEAPARIVAIAHIPAAIATEVERAHASGPEPPHEAMADERGVARGLPGAGLVVDLGREQHRPALVESARDQLVEMRLVAHPVAVGDAGAARDRHDVGGAGGRGSAACR